MLLVHMWGIYFLEQWCAEHIASKDDSFLDSSVAKLLFAACYFPLQGACVYIVSSGWFELLERPFAGLLSRRRRRPRLTTEKERAD